MKSSKTSTATMLEFFDDSKRGVANLMARENITVQVVDGLDTAKFSPELRILQVPNWTGLTVEQCDLLMSHEVGHALFTDRKVPKISKGLFSYLNIVEDARIERRMKSAFPGLAPTFFKGYREFHANGPILKGTNDSLLNPKTGAVVKIATMRLIDRINLHYKIGAFAAVPFTAAEKTILARIDRATSTTECLEIAKELWEADKKPEQQEQKNPSNTPNPKKSPKQENTDEKDESNDSNDTDSNKGESQDGDQSESDDSADGDEDESDKGSKDGDDQSDEGDEDESEADGKGSKDEDEGDEDNDGGNSADGEADDDESDEDGDQSESDNDSDNADNRKSKPTGTDDAKKGAQTVADPSADTDTDDTLKSIASQGNASTIVHLLYPVLPDSVMKDRVVPAREFCERGMKALTANGGTTAELDKLESKWAAKYMATAKHMALEFERKKNAKCLAAVKTAKSGKLDLTKLSQYRWTDDLFKRSMTVPNGKSHGIVMMIDGSGSMSSQFAEVIDQTILFAYFAFQVNIPFEAYMFSDCLDSVDGETIGQFTCESTGLNALTLGASGRLIGLINTTTDRAGFKKQVRVLLAVRSQYRVDYGRCNSASCIPNSHLGGTPLFTGMMIAERLVCKMKNERKLDKTTFIVITDGEDTNQVWFKSNNSNNNPYSYYSYNQNHQGFEAINSPFVVRDAVTKKNLTYVDNNRGIMSEQQNGVLTMLLDVMKLRHDTRTVYIYLQEANRYSYRSRRGTSSEGFDYLVRAGKMNEARLIAQSDITKSLSADGQYVMPANVSVADLAMILPTGGAAMTEDAFTKLDTENMTQKKIAAEFTKAMVNAVANRKFVNSVVPHLA